MRKKTAEKVLTKLPSHIRITPKVAYELLEVEEFKDKATEGETRGDTKQIVVRKGQNPSDKISTYIHEWIHALDFENNVGLTEPQVLKLEKSIMKSLELNKLFDFLGKIC